MPSAYLTPTEAPNYGAPSTVTTLQITQASVLIDAYLNRPEGLIWATDSTGNPCYMAALNPTFGFTLAAPIAPGYGVPVTLNGPVSALSVGDVLILDRGSEDLVEACVVATTVGPSNAVSITLQQVLNAHDANATADYGLVIEEQKYMPAERPLTRVAKAPLMRLISGVGRYGYGRRGDGANYNLEQFNLLAAVTKFGGPPVWELWQPQPFSTWDINTGQVWVPAGIMLAYYSEVKLRYVAGYLASALPAQVKLAAAKLINALAANPALAGNVKTFKAGDTSTTMFAASLLDEDTKAALRPFAARGFV